MIMRSRLSSKGIIAYQYDATGRELEKLVKDSTINPMVAAIACRS
jgi:hypothetical protein